jgi:RNA 2',3'-cyclic 3'-phosphodiesterase
VTADRAKDGQRLFFALWPSDEFRVEAESATRALARESGGRVIPPENLHVTLLFLGRILPAQLQAVQEAGAACANAPAFELSFDRAETWGRANLLCLTTSSSPLAATQLAENLRQRLQREVPGLSEHEFRPHITLARDLPRRRRAEPVQPLRMKVNEFVLVDSRPGPSGSLYSVGMRWPLR